ncbi:hypothetical protein [Candidatus Hodarchaeum mangrovi]
MNKNQQLVKDLIVEKILSQPITELLAFRLLDYSDICTTLKMLIIKVHWNPIQTVHIGTFYDLLAASMRTLFFVFFAKDECYSTVAI